MEIGLDYCRHAVVAAADWTLLVRQEPVSYAVVVSAMRADLAPQIHAIDRQLANTAAGDSLVTLSAD